MPQNIKLNNVRSLDAKVLLDEYYDFMLYKGEAYGGWDPADCLAADFSEFKPDETGKIHSLTSWQGAYNEGVALKDIGFTGIDNGFITYRKDRISNYEFMNILTGSTYEIDSADTRFFMSPVSGNTLEYCYPMSAVTDEEGKVEYMAFNGGFYQGFYKLFGFNYQTLPTKMEYGWTMGFKIRPRSDYENSDCSINAKHPENSGMFFYMGTRAENKFWEFYPNGDEEKEEFVQKNADNDGYMSNECDEGEIYEIYQNTVLNSDYVQDEPDQLPSPCFIDGYAKSITVTDCTRKKYIKQEKRSGDDGFVGWYMGAYNYKPNEFCGYCMLGSDEPENPCDNPNNNYAEICKCCENYFADAYYGECYYGPKCIEQDYLAEDLHIDNEGSGITDSIGQLFNRTGYYEIETDNKFIFFNKTCTGFTTQNWTEGSKVILSGRRNWDNINYFLLMNKTCTGWTTENIQDYVESKEKPYDVYKDIKNNAFGLRITPSGAIGYKYGVLDCTTSASNHYSVVEEYSKDGMVKYDEWNDITVRIAVLNPTQSTTTKFITNSFLSGTTICENEGSTGNHKMKIYVYVNGYLKLVSKELPEFSFRELNDVYQKQEGVPFNISLGGGTQGLMERIGPDYMNSSKYILPLERDFGGSFNGDIKSFKFYDCLLNYSTIKDYLSKNN